MIFGVTEFIGSFVNESETVPKNHAGYQLESAKIKG